MEIHDAGRIQQTPQDFSVQQASSHGPSLQDRTNNVANEPLKESGKLFNPQNESPRLSRQVSFKIPPKSEKVTERAAQEGPRRIKIASSAKRMADMKGSLPPPPQPQSHIDTQRAEGNAALQKPAIDPEVLSKAETKGKPVIKEMASSEKSYSESLGRLVSRDYNGKSVLSRLAELASPADKKIIENYRDLTRAHLKHIKKHLANIEKNAQTADTDFSKGLKDASDSFSKMGEYIDTNATLSLQFADIQTALARTKAANPEGFAKLEEQFKEGKTVVKNGKDVPDNKGFGDIIPMAHQRLSRHEMLTGALIKDTPAEMEGAEGLKAAKSSFVFGNKRINAGKIGVNLNELQARAVKPTELPYAPAQNILKQIMSGSQRTIATVDKNGAKNASITTAKEMKHLLAMSSSAIFKHDELRDVNIFAQLSLAFETASPAEKKELASTLKDILSSDASIPAKPEDKTIAQGYINHFVMQCFKDGIDEGADIAKLSNEKLTLKEAALNDAAGQKIDTTLSEVKGNLAQINKVYNLSKASPEDTFANIHNYLMEGVNNIKLSELAYPDKPQLSPTVVEAARRFDAVTFLVGQQILLSPNPPEAYAKACKALRLAQKEGAWGVAQVLTQGLSNSSVERLLKGKVSNTDKKMVDDAVALFGTNKDVFDKMKESIDKNNNAVPALSAYVGSLVLTGESAIVDRKTDEVTQVNSIIGALKVDANMKNQILNATKAANQFTDKAKDLNSFIGAAEATSALLKITRNANFTDGYKPLGSETPPMIDIYHRISMERRPRGSNRIN